MSCCCVYCISTSEVGIVGKLGKFDRIEDAGCHCINPCSETLQGRLSLRVQQIECRVDTKTFDNALVVIKASVHYKVLHDKIQEAFYKFSNPSEQIRSFASNVIRGQVPKHTVDQIFTVRDEIQKALKEELEEQMATYGFQIEATLITDIDPSNEVKQAMSQIRTNACLRIAAGYEGEVEKIKVVKAAEADSEAKRLSGVGLAEQRKAAILGLQSSVASFSNAVKDMQSREIMALLMMNQYFDALKDIAQQGRGNTVFLPGGTNVDVMEGVLAAQSGAVRQRGKGS
jgi:regulator of protease activity HflC (stomatin/prohibitin superfamily)